MNEPEDRVVRVAQPVQVVRSAGTPAVARVQQPTVQVVRAGMPGNDGRDADSSTLDLALLYAIAKL